MSLTTLGLVPARSGSKGVPGKNTRDFCGKPLLAWAVEVALKTCDRVLVSSDDQKVVHVLEPYQPRAEFLLRPEQLAQDDTPMFPVVKHAADAVGSWKWDVFVLLQPTQPLRTPELIREALTILALDRKSEVDSVVSVVEVPRHYRPDYVMRMSGKWLKDHFRSASVHRRERSPAYSRDGTVYAARHRAVRARSLYGTRCAPLVIPADLSANIDSEDDWTRAEALMRRRLDLG